MEAESVIPKGGESITVPAYDLGWLGTVTAHCFGCHRSFQRPVRFGWVVLIPFCCRRRMYVAIATPFGNASLN
jgi:hypothetical protein